MRHSFEPLLTALRFLSLPLALALLAGCSKTAPVTPAEPPAAGKEHPSAAAATAAPAERREYSSVPGGERAGTGSHGVNLAQLIEAEVRRGGPHGEQRLFESAEEQDELLRGRSPKYMNAQFRYYLADAHVAQPAESGCQRPLLALKLAVESLNGNPTFAIHGRFTFSQVVGPEGAASAPTETLGAPYRADIIGPFSDSRGGIAYVTAYLQTNDAYLDPARWSRIVEMNAARRRVFFAPEVFYYPDGTQYAQGDRERAQRDVMTCGGTEGAVKAMAAAAPVDSRP